MVLTINPTITGGFVHHVMKDEQVKKKLDNLELNGKEAHDFIKRVMILTVRDLQIDFNKNVHQRVDQILEDIEKDEDPSNQQG